MKISSHTSRRHVCEEMIAIHVYIFIIVTIKTVIQMILAIYIMTSTVPSIFVLLPI